MINPDNPVKLTDLLPDAMAGWKAEKTVPLRVNADLYDYMDGGAELYISYGFGEALSCTYHKEGQPEVLAEVFDLLDARNAYGVFTQTREQEIQQFGQGTYRIPGAVFFWKDRYFISISSWESNPGSDAFTDMLASHIDNRITCKGKVPLLVNILPREGMIPDGFKYFHHYVWLNAFFFISDKNLFLIDNSTDALLARYAEGENRKYLLLIQYADAGKALEAFSAFRKDFFPGGLTENCIKQGDNTWLAAAVSDKLIAAVFNSSTRDGAGQLLANALENYGTQNK